MCPGNWFFFIDVKKKCSSQRKKPWKDASCFCVQVKPVQFTVQAVVTSSDLQFDHTEVDFGYCSIYQSVKSSVRLTNLSLLPQDFGFMGVPEVLHENLCDFSWKWTPYFVWDYICEVQLPRSWSKQKLTQRPIVTSNNDESSPRRLTHCQMSGRLGAHQLGEKRWGQLSYHCC